MYSDRLSPLLLVHLRKIRCGIPISSIQINVSTEEGIISFHGISTTITLRSQVFVYSLIYRLSYSKTVAFRGMLQHRLDTVARNFTTSLAGSRICLAMGWSFYCILEFACIIGHFMKCLNIRYMNLTQIQIQMCSWVNSLNFIIRRKSLCFANFHFETTFTSRNILNRILFFSSWMLSTADIYSHFILVQLVCTVTTLACIILQLDFVRRWSIWNS